jgi:hypothetical protein
MTISATPGKMSYTACVPGDASGHTRDGKVEIDFAGGTYVGCEHTLVYLTRLVRSRPGSMATFFPRRSIKSRRDLIWRYTTSGSIPT